MTRVPKKERLKKCPKKRRSFVQATQCQQVSPYFYKEHKNCCVIQNGPLSFIPRIKSMRVRGV